MSFFRKSKLVGLMLAKGLGLFAVSRAVTSGSVRILCYHGTWLPSDGWVGDAMFMSARTFARRLETIRRLSYPVIPFSEAIDAVTGRIVPGTASVAITIDDGWYSTYRDMLPELRKHGMPATLYCDTANLLSERPVVHVLARYLRKLAPGVTLDAEGERALSQACDQTLPYDERMAAARVLARKLDLSIDDYLDCRAFDYMSPEQLAEAARDGLDVQLHTHNHTMHDHGAAAVANEIQRNRREIAALLGTGESDLVHFCYPSGDCSADVARVVEAAGIVSATTTRQGLALPGCDLHLVPRLLDGEQITQIEFEAELSGFADLMRWTRATLKSVLRLVAGAPLSHIKDGIAHDHHNARPAS